MKPTNAASIEKVEAPLHAVMTELAKKRELAAEAKTQPVDWGRSYECSCMRAR
jgi:hypothetical protein